MENLIIIIAGRIPSKKNSVGMMVRGGRVFKFPNSAYQKWHKEATKQLKKMQIPNPCEMTIDFYFPDARRTDLTNKAESIMDLLVDNDIIPDDNCAIVPTLKLNYRGIDRVNPRAEISWQIKSSPLESNLVQEN